MVVLGKFQRRSARGFQKSFQERASARCLPTGVEDPEKGLQLMARILIQYIGI